jgi:hypothetical protein
VNIAPDKLSGSHPSRRVGNHIALDARHSRTPGAAAAGSRVRVPVTDPHGIHLSATTSSTR